MSCEPADVLAVDVLEPTAWPEATELGPVYNTIAAWLVHSPPYGVCHHGQVTAKGHPSYTLLFWRCKLHEAYTQSQQGLVTQIE